MAQQHTMRRRLAAGAAVAAASLALAACGGSDPEPTASPTSSPTGGGQTSTDTPDADSCEAIAGESITFVVPYNPGGGFDAFVRFLEPFMEEHLGGDVQVNVENRPGGGGLVGANTVYTSNPDDLTIGLINYPGAVFAELTEQEGATFDNTEWTVLGRLGALPPLVYTAPDSQYVDFETMLAATDPVKFGIGGVGSDAYYVAVVLSEVFQFPNEIIGGYPGSGEADAAMLVGEVDAGINSGGAGILMVTGSGAIPIVVVSNEPLPELPDVPLIDDFADGDNAEVLSALASMYDLERVVVGPPGMDEDAASCIGDAILAAANEAEYEEQMEAAGYPINPLGRTETAELADTVAGSTDALRELLAD